MKNEYSVDGDGNEKRNKDVKRSIRKKETHQKTILYFEGNRVCKNHDVVSFEQEKLDGPQKPPQSTNNERNKHLKPGMNIWKAKFTSWAEKTANHAFRLVVVVAGSAPPIM
jgi:hypothetical protein